jgi:Domain of unknown function (DUF4157)
MSVTYLRRGRGRREVSRDMQDCSVRSTGNRGHVAAWSRQLDSAPPSGLFVGRAQLQARLEVGAADDPLEREADRVAGHVLRMPDPGAARRPLSRTSVRSVQRAWSCGGTAEGECAGCAADMLQRRGVSLGSDSGMPAPAAVHEALGTAGQPLDTATRTFIEPRLGLDLSPVRVHTGTRAEESARAVNALAYTVGQHVVFGSGQYAPGTAQGRRLLTHELMHTVQQQTFGSQPLLQRMTPCPSNLNKEAAVPAGWQPYHGDPCVFHCCYRGILEDRRPTPDDPQNECFFDEAGRIVDQNHPYAGCRGTPNQYDSATDPIRHALLDTGGIVRKGWGAYWESRRHEVGPQATCEPRYLGGGAYLGRDCIVRQGLGPKL